MSVHARRAMADLASSAGWNLSRYIYLLRAIALRPALQILTRPTSIMRRPPERFWLRCHKAGMDKARGHPGCEAVREQDRLG